MWRRGVGKYFVGFRPKKKVKQNRRGCSASPAKEEKRESNYFQSNVLNNYTRQHDCVHYYIIKYTKKLFWQE